MRDRGRRVVRIVSRGVEGLVDESRGADLGLGGY